MSSVETITIEGNLKFFIEDIFYGLLSKFTLPSPNFSLSKEKEEIVLSIFELTKEARSKSVDVFKHIDSLINAKTDAEKEESFFNVIDGLFDGKYTWGKVVVAFGFMIEVLIRVMNYKHTYETYCDLSKRVLLKYIHPWVIVNGGWVNFVNINIANEYNETRETITNVGKVLFVAAGIWAISKFLTN